MLALHPTHSNVILVGLPGSLLERKRSIQSPVTVNTWLLSVHYYLAVEHLISCHVVQLNPVQIISAKHTFSLLFRIYVHLCWFPHEWACRVQLLMRQRGNISLILSTVFARSQTMAMSFAGNVYFFGSCNVRTDQPSVCFSAAHMPPSPCWVIIRFLVDNLPLILLLMIWGFMLYTVHSHVITQTHELQIWLRGPQLEQSDLFL